MSMNCNSREICSYPCIRGLLALMGALFILFENYIVKEYNKKIYIIDYNF